MSGATGMGSNLRPLAYKASALPAELRRHLRGRVAEGGRIELLTFRSPRFSRPVAGHSAAPSLAEGVRIERTLRFSRRLRLSKPTHYRSATPPRMTSYLIVSFGASLSWRGHSADRE